MMRIKTIDVSDGRQRITLVCDQCHVEAAQDS
jgi:hypothetical protein